MHLNSNLKVVFYNFSKIHSLLYSRHYADTVPTHDETPTNFCDITGSYDARRLRMCELSMLFIQIKLTTTYIQY